MRTLKEIAEMVGGHVVGQPTIEIRGIAPIENSQWGDLTFAKTSKWFTSLQNSRATAALVPSTTTQKQLETLGIPCVLVDHVETAFSAVAAALCPPITRPVLGVSPLAYVSPTAEIGEDVTIYPGAFVGDHVKIGRATRVFPGACLLENCQIGANVTIFPNAVLYEKTVVGDGSIIHAGAVLGAYGFGYDSNSQGHRLLDQFGNVELGTDVDIGACTTIDRGSYGPTRVGDGSKLDNQVMVGHNCQIGQYNLLCSQVGIAGSCQTGSFVVMAGQVGIGDHIRIGNNATLCAKSGVMHNLEAGKTYLGAPAIPAREEFQIVSARTKLPQLRKQIKELQKRVEQLSADLAAMADGQRSSEAA